MKLFDIFKKKTNQDKSTTVQQTDDMHTKNLRNIDSCDEDEAASKAGGAVESLRKQIIEKISEKPAAQYQLASLFWQDAANCFPNSRFKWDGAWFKLDLQTGKLSAKVGTYPNQFGACHEDFFPLSAAEFNSIAKQFNMSKELQAFKSDEDWEKLFDDSLKATVASACAILQKQEEDRKNAEISQYAVKIPANYINGSPNMGLSEITIEISQRYSSRRIQVENQNGEYQVVYTRISHMSPSIDRCSRVLSVAEAVWLEKQVESVIKNPDESTWQSLPGGDTMNIVIKKVCGKNIFLQCVKPIRKYSDLQNELENLVQYGHRIVKDNTFGRKLPFTKTAVTPKVRSPKEENSNAKGQGLITKKEYIWHVYESGRTTDYDDILEMFSDCGVQFTSISMRESHDLGDQDWYVGHFSSIEELLTDKIHRKYSCEWNADGVYNGAKLCVHLKDWNIFGGVHVRYERQDTAVIDILLREFGNKFRGD